MRRLALLAALIGFLGFSAMPASAEDAGLAPGIIQVQATSSSSWTAGRVVAVGVGLVAGMAVANAVLPGSWGLVNPVVGAVVGGMLGSWSYSRMSEPGSMLRQPAAAGRSVEAPSLFQLANATAE